MYTKGDLVSVNGKAGVILGAALLEPELYRVEFASGPTQLVAAEHMRLLPQD